MFCYGVVFLFPAVQSSIAMKACSVVRVRLVRLVVKAGVCQL